LRYASERYQNNPTIVFIAVTENPDALKYASTQQQENPLIQLQVEEQKEKKMQESIIMPWE